MTESAADNRADYTRDAHQAILAAVRDQRDFGGWLAGVLASVSAELGSTDALIASRPGSWEADLIRQLFKGTVGWDDDFLADHRSHR